MKTKITAINSAAIILSLLMIGAALIMAPPCSGTLELAAGAMIPMKCTYTAKAAVLLSIILLAAALENIMKKRLSPLTFIIIGLSLLVLPFPDILGIGVCVKEGMACFKTALWLKSIGGLTALLGIISIFVRGKYDL